ncbi:hypothetical protein AJ80_05586 [Polytolypa hystricis UAMH7299]|uniref:Cyclohexanone monooxygenase n=1 Tax=Polytolypa hystricis (strain UAMH7299) TaxID=1447883 RepID=A0A2B7Y3I8_POLH7|nr:hypothetical protein AJ80_05586 [Polytolypa hystricis UAMH7299]
MADNKRYPQAEIGNKTFTQAAVVIIGAGISGMCTAINLLNNNIHNFVILEKSGGFGGTWRDNKYPGCCCDIYAHLYSYSFEQNPDWTRLYAGQEEILKYLHGVAEKYKLARYIRFNSSVEETRWDDAARKWNTAVTVAGAKDSEFGEQYTITSDFLVSAVGQLNFPQNPSIPGLDDFKGKMMHSARWDWSYDLKGKRIAVIGNGATAAQIVPEIAPEASHLTIYQRTPNWVAPRLDIPVWKPVRAMFKYLPPVRWRFRATIMDFREVTYSAVTNQESTMANFIRNESLKMMKRQLPNQPELWEKVTPDYPVGCKRILLSDNYFPTLARKNVTLETGHIERITEKGIVVDSVETEYDLIVLATGFRTVEFMHPIKVYGTNGRSLSDIWSKTQGARALYGVTVESLPNFGMLYGPNTNLGHNSIILMIEAQARYIYAMISAVLRARQQGQSLAITPKPSRVEGFNAEMQEVLKSTSFAHPNCSSWYKTEEGLITNNWSGTVVDYQKLLSKLDWNDFDLAGYGSTNLGAKTTHLGRVREESMVGYKTLGVAVSVLAVAGGIAMKAPHLLPRWK